MPAKLYAGPYDSIPIGPNTQAPWYVIPFDDQGRCTAPLTRGQLVDAVKHGDFTDIYLFSHGWNNDWRDAVGDDPSGVATGGGYRGMFEAYGRLRRDHNLAYNRPYRPLLIGIFWPSAWLVRPSEAAPQIAADDPQLAEAAVAQERRALEELARLIDGADVEAFYAFTQQEKLSEDDARELARILLPVFNRASGAGAGDIPAAQGTATPDQLVELWRKIGQREKPRDTGAAGGRLGVDHEGSRRHRGRPRRRRSADRPAGRQRHRPRPRDRPLIRLPGAAVGDLLPVQPAAQGRLGAAAP